MSLETYRVFCLSKAISPITHMGGSSGNESVLSREKVISADGEHHVPFLSGNALRHKILREPLMHDLCERLGLRGKLSLLQANFLFHGGSMFESSTTEDIGLMRRIQDVAPAIRLLGGSLTNRIVDGRVRVGRGALVCAENTERLKRMFPGHEWPHNLLGSKAFETGYQYVRYDVRRLDTLDTVDRADTDHKTTPMIFAGQAVVPGAVFAHDLAFTGTPVELGAVLHGLALWQSKGGIVGGMAAKGHGRLSTKWAVTPDLGEDEQAALIQSYLDHVDANGPALVEWLNEAFAPKQKKAKGSAT